jgi:DNA-binding NarL/FixJ family response regulator
MAKRVSKLNVADRAQAIVRARESGLGTSNEG